MERVRVIDKKIAKKNTKAYVGALPITATEIFYSTVLVLIFILCNTFSFAKLYTNARHNEVLRQQLITLKKENSSLEEKKANLVNIREVQRKAVELGFVHNNSVNYVK